MFSRSQLDILQSMDLVVYLPYHTTEASKACVSDDFWDSALGRNIRRHLNGIAPERLALLSTPGNAESKRGLWRQIRALLHAA